MVLLATLREHRGIARAGNLLSVDRRECQEQTQILHFAQDDSALEKASRFYFFFFAGLGLFFLSLAAPGLLSAECVMGSGPRSAPVRLTWVSTIMY